MGVVTPVVRHDVYLVDLDPTQGSEIQRTRPCIVVSPDEMNRHLHTVIVAPMTSQRRAYPTRVDVRIQNRTGQVALDQIRTIDKARLVKRLGRISPAKCQELCTVLQEMFAFA